MEKIQIGVLTSEPEPMEGFDLTSYYVKSCTGLIDKPASQVYNIISCFCDNITARKNPEWVAISEAGKAVRSNRDHRFLWDHICPSVEEYKEELFNLIRETLKADVTGIHLDCIGFPRSKYCTCQRCKEGWRESGLRWVEWRSKVVGDFVAHASKIVKGESKSFSVTLLPDPFFGKERYGEDLRRLEKYVDFFLVPIYDLAYSTTYWLETLAYGFHKQLESPFYIELYAADPGPKLKNLLAAIVAISDYVNGITLATHNPDLIQEIQEKLAKDEKYAHYLDKRGCQSMKDIVNRWKVDYGL